MAKAKLTDANHFKAPLMALFLGQVLFSCKPSVEELGGPLSGTQRETTHHKAISYQGVSFELSGSGAGSSNTPTVAIEGNFDQRSDFFSSGGDFLAVFEGSCNTAPVFRL